MDTIIMWAMALAPVLGVPLLCWIDPGHKYAAALAERKAQQ